MGEHAYSIITQDSAPKMFRQSFESVESRYVRRSAYIPQFQKLFEEVERLCLTNEYKPCIDGAGNIVFQIPEDDQ